MSAVGAQLAVADGFPKSVEAVAFDWTGTRLAVASGALHVLSFRDDSIVADVNRERAWHRPALRHVTTHVGHEARVIDVVWIDDHTIITLSGDRTIRRWRDTEEMVPILRGHRSSVLDVAFLANGRIIASGGGREQLIMWDALEATPVRKQMFRDKSARRAWTASNCWPRARTG